MSNDHVSRFIMRKNFIRLTVDVAEATSLALLGVMETSSPVDGDVAFAAVKTSCAFHAASGANTAEFEETVKDWTVIPDIILSLLFCIVLHVVRGDFLQEVDVLISMKLRHLMFICGFRALK
jgi:hypothetical protein